MRVGIISDTHGPVPAAALDALRAENVDRIIHLGDFGGESHLAALEAIAPLVAVKGNNDFSSSYPLTSVLDWGGVRLLLAHMPGDLERILREAPDDTPILALHGHTHVPRFEQSGNVTRINPGAAARPRAGSPRSLLILDVEDGTFTHRFIEIEQRAGLRPGLRQSATLSRFLVNT